MRILLSLLNKHISNIPEDEILSALYIVNGETKYASTKLQNETYNLYQVSEYKLIGYEDNQETLGILDTIVAAKINKHIIKQSAIVDKEKQLRIVEYLTDYKQLTKPATERTEIIRYDNKKQHRLF